MAGARLEIISRNRRGSMLVVQSDIRSIRRGFRRLGRKVTNEAVRKSLNQAGRKVMTRAKREIAGHRNLKISEVGRKLRFRPAKGFRLAPHIEAKGRPISLMKLKTTPRQLKKGVRVRTQKGKPFTLLEGAFIATMRGRHGVQKGGGHVGVFERRGKARLPIREYTLPSIAHTLVNEVVSARLEAFADEQIDLRLKANLNRQLARLPGAR
ncbi:MAG: phage tail protein [Alphaproteobacteria bacterium]